LKKVNSIGRLFRYCYLKMVKEKGTPDYIARGWTLGVLANWIVPIGQTALSFPLSFLIKGSKIGAILGTMVTNPLTTLFLYPLQCYIGNFIIGGDLSMEFFRQALKKVVEDQTFEAALKAIQGTSTEVIISFWVGGLVFCLLTGPLTYVLTRSWVIRFRKLRAWRRAQKAIHKNNNHTS
jgi:hypothetical protein